MTSSSIQIKRLHEVDVQELQALAILTYRDTYKDNLTPEEVELRIKSKHARDVFVRQLQDPEHFFWGAYEEQALIGYLHLTLSGKSESVSTVNFMQLSRIYIHPDSKRNGVGHLFMQRAEEFTLEQGKQGLWLHCFDQNLDSIRFYEKEGYQRVGKDSFEITPGLKRFDVVMTKKIVKRSL